MSRARELKSEFTYKWCDGVIREWIAKLLLELAFLKEDLPVIIMWTGVGTGNAEYVPENYSNPLNAFDLVIYDRNMRIIAYLEVTGTDDLQRGEELCINSSKVFKAERFGVQDKVWYIHVLLKKLAVRVINYHKLKRISGFRRLQETKNVYGYFYCSETRKWGDIEDLTRWIRTRVRR